MATLTGFPASNTISPSVRIIEKDLSFLPATPVFNRSGVVGFASKGPINVPTFIGNVTQLHTVFGFPHPADSNPYLIYAGEQYLSAGTELWVVRVAETDPVNAEAATTASVDVLSAGGLIEIISDTISPYSFSTNTFFRWRLNGSLAAKVLVVLADANRPAPDTGMAYTAETLAETLNAQVVFDDGIEFFATTDDRIGVRSTWAYGPDASIEFVSVSSALYGPILDVDDITGTLTSLPPIAGLGTGMTPAVNVGANDRWPNNIYQTAGVWDFTGLSNVNLQIVISGTGNSTIDNVVQVVPLASTSGSTLAKVTEINDYILNNLPGGWFAYKIGNNIALTTRASGRDSRLLVKAASSAATIFGFSTTTVGGASPSGVTGDLAVASYGITFGTANTTGEVTFTIFADSPGIEGNRTQVVVNNDPEQGTFTFQIFSNSLPVEAWGNITKDETSQFYVETFMALVSDFIRVEDNTLTGALPTTGTYDLSGGSDGIPADPDDQDDLIIGSRLGMTGLGALSEPEQINIDLLAVPGFSSRAVIDAMIDLCQNQRQDCMAVIDPPFGLSVQEIVLWQNGRHPLNLERFDSSYAALYWPWLKIRDTTNRIDVWVPPSGSILAVFALSDSIAAPWFAAAGLERGVVPNVLDVYSRPTLSQRDFMYGYQNAVNPVVQFVGVEGFLVWGNKTLQRRASALDRVNVRRGLIAMEKLIREEARALLFEPHDEILRQRFVNIATAVLRSVQVNRGLTDFRVKCDEELNPPDDVIDRNELRARIGVQPTRAAEFIFIEFSIHRTGSFTENADTF
jgi:hypothetical protein